MIDIEKYKSIRKNIYAKFYRNGAFIHPHTEGVATLLTDFIKLFGKQTEMPITLPEPPPPAPKKWITIKDFIDTTGRLSSSTFCKLFKLEEAKKFSMRHDGVWFFEPWEVLTYCRDNVKGSVKKDAEYILNSEIERKKIEELIEKKSQPVL